MVIWIAAILIITAVALFIAAPLSDYHLISIRSAMGAEPERPDREHTLAVQALRELEFDHAMGKLDAEDYRALRQKLELRALAGMGAVHSPEREPSAEAYVPAVNFCIECGASLDRRHNFCPKCGSGRAVIAHANA